jgi:thiamine biosynthesis lipoprotein
MDGIRHRTGSATRSRARLSVATRPRALLTMALVGLLACNDSAPASAHPGQSADAPNAAPAVQAPAPAEAAKPLVSEKREIMGTWFELKIAGASDPEHARAALKRGLDEIARLEEVLSEWRPSSAISRINDGAGKTAVTVDPDVLANVKAGLAVSRWSDGAFDLSWAAMRGLYSFDPTKPPVIPAPKDVERLRKLVDYRAIVLDESARTVRLAKKGMAIGTGGIAKGYALDRVGQILEQAGYPNYLLFAGGQVQMHGSRDGRAWRIGIKHPRRDTHVGFFEVHDGSVSTSGDYEHYFVHEGRVYHHIIDVSTGYPATKSSSVTLIAPEGIYADALSTACFVQGPAPCLAMLEKLPFKASAVIIDPDMRVHISPGIADRVKFNPPLVDGRLPGVSAP